MRLFDTDHFKSIFGDNEFDAEVFIMIVNTFLSQVIENETFNNAEE